MQTRKRNGQLNAKAMKQTQQRNRPKNASGIMQTQKRNGQLKGNVIGRVKNVLAWRRECGTGRVSVPCKTNEAIEKELPTKLFKDESLTTSGRICKLHPKEALCISRERKYFIHCTVLINNCYLIIILLLVHSMPISLPVLLDMASVYSQLILPATGGHRLSRMLLVAICFWTLTCTALSKDVVVYKDYYGVQGVICMDNYIQKLLSRHSELFKDELGLVKGVTVKLYVDPSATPRFFRPRSVPHALRGRVEQELERLEKTDDLLAGLEKGKFFSTLDLAHAYLQLQLDEESRKLATISTHKEHLQILEQVLTRLEEVGIRLKESKCQFLLPSVEYLGYRISVDGIQPTEEKLRAIRDAPTPRDLSQLKSFLGLLNYYAPAEKKYSQLEKEGLAIVFGVKKFHQYLYGRKFVVHSDHKPLQFLCKEDKPVPTMASARIQRWALTLSAYDYRIVFRAGNENSNADGLSRLPLRESPSSVPVPGDTVLMMEALSDMGSAVSATAIKSWTDRDPVLSRVRRMVLHGWQQQEGVDFQPYQQRKHELSVEDGCVLWGSRVVVPPAGREAVVRLLHEGHPGISRMKALARGVVWWPGLDSQLESKVKECVACQSSRKSPPKAPLHPWEWPTKPWVRLHVDLAGLFLGKTLMVIVDAHSKWLEASIVSSSSAEQAIRVLRHVFSTHGLPEVLVSDNGSAFTSAQFQTFVKLNGFRHVKSAPYHPASNGLAERAVQTVKEALKTTGDLETRLARFFFQYRLIPHSTTGQPPAELLMGRHPRSHLDFLFPSGVQQSQERQKTNHDQHVQSKTFQVGDEVYVVNHRGSPKWLPGVVVKLLGPLNLLVKIKGGQEARYHIDHVRARTGREKGINNDDSDIEEDDDDPLPPVLGTPPVPALPPGEVDQQQMFNPSLTLENILEDLSEVLKATAEQRKQIIWRLAYLTDGRRRELTLFVCI
ncbi:hypothetical protein EMCRGX_G003317 [Ephydatia muelleri]